MPDEAQIILLDQNVARRLVGWLGDRLPHCTLVHTSDVGLAGARDEEIGDWARARGAVIVSFDSDFADQRKFPIEQNAGVVFLRVRPTTATSAMAGLWSGSSSKST